VLEFHGFQRLMTLTQQEVRHIAWLARLAVSEDDVERFRADLSAILDHFTALQELNTDDVPAAAHASLLTTVVREDVARESLSSDEVLANAPREEDSLFSVAPILDLE
jgi:aspartyl-tRNA(Asn)/glutamyl-tRNA(Gln) amidotransferase subunit C